MIAMVHAIFGGLQSSTGTRWVATTTDELRMHNLVYLCPYSTDPIAEANAGNFGPIGNVFVVTLLDTKLASELGVKNAGYYRTSIPLEIIWRTAPDVAAAIRANRSGVRLNNISLRQINSEGHS